MKTKKTESVSQRTRKPTTKGADKARASKSASKPKAAAKRKASAKDAPHTSAERNNIALEAYLIWESEGFPQGQEVAHWLRAEQRLLGQPAHS